MISKERIAGSLAGLAALLLTVPAPLAAQDILSVGPAPADVAQPVVEMPDSVQADDPWLYRGGDIPVDPQWIFGELDNGLRYAVRENGVPPGQVSIRVRIDAGSLHESESELGYAHLIEHLTFRESKYLAEGAAIPTWQRLGATFGSDTNAETSPTHTVYRLDLPNADEAKVEESMKLLSGMIREPALSAGNLALDVPIVKAELREREGPGMRVAQGTQAVFFKDQLLAARMPIGTVASLSAATPASVRAFHERWYRPGEAVVVAVGDVDPAFLATMVERYFGDWQVAGGTVAEPDFGRPRAPAGATGSPPVGETGVLVEPSLPQSISVGWLRQWEQVIDNLEYNRGLMLDAVSLAILNRRLEARARGDASFLTANVDQQDIARSVDATLLSVTPLDNNWEEALAEARGVIADALANPPSQDEIDREVSAFEVSFANSVEQESIQAGGQLADMLVNAVDIREMVASPQVAYDLFTGMRARFTPAAILDHTRRLFEGEVVRSVLVTPTPIAGGEAAVRTALAAPVSADLAARSEDTAIAFADLPPIGEPGTILSDQTVTGLGFRRVAFANGVQAVLWDVDNEPGRVTVKVRFGTGMRAFEGEDAPYIALGRMALVGQGLGPLGQDALDRIATGRKFGFDFEIDDGTFAFEAQTRAADLADQLYLFAGKLAMPRWDAAPVLRARAAAQLQYESFTTSPAGILARDLEWLLAGRDPRFATAAADEFAAATPEGFRAVWEPVLASGPIEVLVFGDIESDAAVAALARTFGAMPPRAAPDPAQLARQVPFLDPQPAPITLTHAGQADQAAAAVAWETGAGVDGIVESRKLEILSQLFNNRLLDALRERVGASYAPQVASEWPTDIDSGGHLLAVAQLPPAMVGDFFTEADRIAQDLATNGPTPEELQRVTEPLRQLLLRIQTGHAFWLSQIEGATVTPQRVASLGTLLPDYTETTPAEMRALAARYLADERALKIEVLPESLVARAD